MGPIAWSTTALLVCIASVVVVFLSLKLRRRCLHAGSREHAAETTGELTPQIAKRPKTAFFWAFAFTFLYWAGMFAFYLSSLGSTQSFRAFALAWEKWTLPSVVLSLGLTLWFLSAGGQAVNRATVRGPAVKAVEVRSATMAAGWLGVALFSILFAATAFSRGF